MQENEIRDRVKSVISKITGIDSNDIADDASFVDDLGLDSLSMMEIEVDVDLEFKLDIPEEELPKLRTVQDAVELVQALLCRKAEVA